MEYTVENWLSERGYETVSDGNTLSVIDGKGNVHALDTAAFGKTDGGFRASGDTIRTALAKSGAGGPRGYTPLRNTLAAKGATVGYDKEADAPIVNGQLLNKNDSRLIKVGDDYWMEKSFAESFVPKKYENPYEKKTDSVLSELTQMRFSYDPKKDTALHAAQEEAMLAAAQSANSRGLLGGSTAEIMRQRAAQALVPQYEALARERFEADRAAKMDTVSLLGSLAKNAFSEYQTGEGLALQQKQLGQDAQSAADDRADAAFRNELDKVMAMGVVDKNAAAVLGVPEGTVTKDQVQFMEKLMAAIEEERLKAEAAETEWERKKEFLKMQTDEKIRAQRA